VIMFCWLVCYTLEITIVPISTSFCCLFFYILTSLCFFFTIHSYFTIYLCHSCVSISCNEALKEHIYGFLNFKYLNSPWKTKGCQKKFLPKNMNRPKKWSENAVKVNLTTNKLFKKILTNQCYITLQKINVI
jgi:hypothetical protein